MHRPGRDRRTGRCFSGPLSSDWTRRTLFPGLCRILGGRSFECIGTESLQSPVDGQSRTGSSTVPGPGSHDVEPALDPDPGDAAGSLGLSLGASHLANPESDDSSGRSGLPVALLWRCPSISKHFLVRRTQFYPHHARVGNGANYSLDPVGADRISLFRKARSR